ncbi:Transposase C of IS166 homeodomain-containing protein [Pseudomonas sp. NFACC24-1]|nr:Transposase C of IS166 homeodomain-containing protein [Pseudomonas sp. NFACC24-1]
MTPEQLRALAEQALQLLSQVDSMGQKIHRLETVNEQLAHEIAILKRHKFAKRSEQLSPNQGSLLDDLLDTDIAAIEAELKTVNPPPAPDELRQKPKRAPLPPQFPRTVIRHEPENTQCGRFRDWRNRGTFDRMLKRLHIRLNEQGLIDLET